MFDVTKFGVVGDGTTNNTEAIRALIETAAPTGGTLYFPPGQYLTGSIRLKSNMTLYLDAGAVILGSAREEDYLELNGIEGLRPYRSALISAVGEKNVTIAGNGILDGQGQNWWHIRKDRLRPRAIQMILCENVKIKDIKIQNSATWTVHPLCCNNVTVDGITIVNPANSPNTDGINPESCKNVHIANCHIDVGDDCITLKAGTENDMLQKTMPCENITITNCTMHNGHGGVVIGSEMSGGVRNVVITNCVFHGTDRGVRIKTRRKRAGIVEDLMFQNIIMEDVKVPIALNTYYRCDADEHDMELFSLDARPLDASTPIIRNISMDGLLAKRASVSAAYLYGLPECPISGLRFTNVRIQMENDGTYFDEPIMSAQRRKTCGEGLFAANVSDFVLSNVKITPISGKDVTFHQCEQVVLDGKQLF